MVLADARLAGQAARSLYLSQINRDAEFNGAAFAPQGPTRSTRTPEILRGTATAPQAPNAINSPVAKNRTTPPQQRTEELLQELAGCFDGERQITPEQPVSLPIQRPLPPCPTVCSSYTVSQFVFLFKSCPAPDPLSPLLSRFIQEATPVHHALLHRLWRDDHPFTSYCPPDPTSTADPCDATRRDQPLSPRIPPS